MTVREKVFVVLGVIAIATIVVTTRGVPIWRQWRSGLDAELAELTVELAQARAIFAELPALVDSMEVKVARASVAIEGAFLGDPTTAALELARTASAIGAQKGVIVTSSSPVVDSDVSGSVAVVQARVSGEADVHSLSEWLGGLRRSPRVIRVVELRARPQDVFASSEAPERIHVDLTVAGLLVRAERGWAGEGR